MSVKAVSEVAVDEIQQNDADEQVRDTVSKGWSKDQWLSGVLERALGIVARSAEKGDQEFKLTPWASDAVRYSVQDDRHLSTFYEEEKGWSHKHLERYFPIRNIDLNLQGHAIHIQGTQRPDSISLLKVSGNDTDKRVCICFEGDAHDIDQGKGKGGMYLHEKMFQDASLCHDINPDVPAIFITSALWRHDKDIFRTFSDWSHQFLQEHVRLVEQLLQYVHNKETSSIHRKLCGDGTSTETRDFDFYCWVNARLRESTATIESEVPECFRLMKDQQKRSELQNVLDWRRLTYGCNDVDVAASNDGLRNQTFQAKVISTNRNGIPVVIFAVPRVQLADLQNLAAAKEHACSGIWYPMHMSQYVHNLRGRFLQNFLVPRQTLASTLEFEKLSELPYTNATTQQLQDAYFSDAVKTTFSGHVVFGLPWLWVNIGFLSKLKSSLTYKVAKNNANTLKAYVAFTRKHATQVNSRDTVRNPMRMFSDTSTSLFSYTCKQRSKEMDLDDDLTSFFEQRCGWSNTDRACSPAVFFKMVGARNLISAHTLARQVDRKSALSDKCEETKAVFPLAAQVEINYAMECLRRHYYFVQDKTVAGHEFVRREDFDKMKQKLEQQLRASERRADVPVARDDVKEEDKDDAESTGSEADDVDTDVFPGKEQKANGRDYKVPIGYRIADNPGKKSMKITFLKGRTIVVLWDVENKTYQTWYPGTIVDQARDGTYGVRYPGDSSVHYTDISDLNYRTFWLLVEKIAV